MFPKKIKDRVFSSPSVPYTLLTPSKSHMFFQPRQKLTSFFVDISTILNIESAEAVENSFRNSSVSETTFPSLIAIILIKKYLFQSMS